MSDPNASSPGGPFAWLEPRFRGRALAVLMLVTSMLSIWLAVGGAPLTTEAAPNAIVSFELARTADASAAILASWDTKAREAAMLVQGIDTLYLLAYPAMFSLAAVQLGGRLKGRWLRIGIPLAWAMWLAAPLDLVENLALIAQIESGASEGAAFVAWACALPKFALVIALALFALAGLVALASRRLRGDV